MLTKLFFTYWLSKACIRRGSGLHWAKRLNAGQIRVQWLRILEESKLRGTGSGIRCYYFIQCTVPQNYLPYPYLYCVHASVVSLPWLFCRVADSHHLNADLDPEPTFQFNADPDPDIQVMRILDHWSTEYKPSRAPFWASALPLRASKALYSSILSLQSSWVLTLMQTASSFSL